MEGDEVETISSTGTPSKETISSLSDLEERNYEREESPKSPQLQHAQSPSQSADPEQTLVPSDKEHTDTASGGDEFVSPAVSSSNLNEIELEPQPEHTDSSTEQVINLTQQIDSPITIPTASQQDSSSNYSPPRASSPESSSDSAAPPARPPAASPPTSRSTRSRGKEPEDFLRGQLVWAKVTGFKFWPGLVVDANTATNLPPKLRTPYREDWLLIHFFGTYDYAWVPPKSSIVSWYLGSKKGYMKKGKGKSFQLGLTEANRFRSDGTIPTGFSVVPQVLESGSESDSIISVESSDNNKPTTAKRKLCGNNVAVVSIKKMKLSDYQASCSSKEGNLAESSKSKRDRDRKRRCEVVMKRLGLAPPDKHLGRKLPPKVNTDPDFEL